MSLQEAASIAAAVVALAGAVVAVLARRDANRAAGAADRSAGAAEELVAIETDRRREQLTPQLTTDASCRGPGSDRVRLTVKLDGPAGLDRLDQVSVRVRDDKHRTAVTAGEPSQEQIDATIWGPYRFVPGVDGADRLGRTVGPFSLARGDSRSLVMQLSLTPRWYGGQGQWREEQAEQPIRLELMCARDGGTAWRIPRDLEQPQPRFRCTTEVHQADQAVTLIAHNVGTAPARGVSFSPPPSDPMVVEGDTIPLLEVGHRASAIVFLPAESKATWVELLWTDQLSVPRRQQVDLH